MNKRMYLPVFGLLVALFLSLMISSEGKTEPIVIRFSHVVAEDTPKGIGAQMFKELVEQRLPGKVVVEIYPRSEKFTDEQAIIGLLLGDVEMVAPSFSKFCRFGKSLEIFDVPFMFDNVAEVHRFQQSDAGQKLLSSMESVGIKGLQYWDNGMRVLSANKPIKAPEDLKGLCFRIESSRVFYSQYTGLGATPMILPYKELPEALKIGIVDGYENSWSNILASKLYLLRRNYTEVDHTFLGYMVATSVSFWDGLPDDIRQELERALNEVTDKVNKLAEEKAMADRATLLEAGLVEVISLNEDERQEWKDLLGPMASQFADDIDPKIMLSAKEAKY